MSKRLKRAWWLSEAGIRREVKFINRCRETRNWFRKEQGLPPVPMMTIEHYKNRIQEVRND